MKIIVPISIGISNVTSSNLPLDYAYWSSGTDYTVGTRVSFTDEYVYEAVQNSGPSYGGAQSPPNATYWLLYSATNKMKSFDGIINDRATTPIGNITYTIDITNIITSIAFLNLANIDSIDINIYQNADLIYTNSIDTTINGLYKQTASITGIPPYSNTTTYITFNATANAGVGEIIFGKANDIGITNSGVTAGINDYSIKQADDFGYFTVVERAYSKRVSGNISILTSKVNTTLALLADIRSIPVVWVWSDRSDYSSTLLVYGFYKDIEISIDNNELATFSLSIEGII